MSRTNIHLGHDFSVPLVSEHQAAFQPHDLSVGGSLVPQSNSHELRKQHFSLGYGQPAHASPPCSTHKQDYVDHSVTARGQHLQNKNKNKDEASAAMSKFTDHWTLGTDACCYVSEAKAAFSAAGDVKAAHPPIRSRVTNLFFGTDALDYRTTTAAAHQEISGGNSLSKGPEEGRRRAAELRRSSVNLSSSEKANYRSSYEAEFVAHALKGASGEAASVDEGGRIVFGNYPAQFESESRGQYGRDLGALVKACAEVTRHKQAGQTNVVLGSSVEGGMVGKSEAQEMYVDHQGGGGSARAAAMSGEDVRRSSIYLSGSRAFTTQPSVAKEAFVAYSAVEKVESVKPKGGSNVVLGYERRTGAMRTIEKEMMEMVYAKNDELLNNKKQAQELKNQLRSRKTSFMIGTDSIEYSTTTASTFVQHKDATAGVLADNVKKDLRSTHYVLGDNKPDYATTTSAAHIPYNLEDQSAHLDKSEQTGTHFTIGMGRPDDKPARSVAQDSFRWPSRTEISKNL